MQWCQIFVVPVLCSIECRIGTQSLGMQCSIDMWRQWWWKWLQRCYSDFWRHVLGTLLSQKASNCTILKNGFDDPFLWFQWSYWPCPDAIQIFRQVTHSIVECSFGWSIEKGPNAWSTTPGGISDATSHQSRAPIETPSGSETVVA